MAAWFKFYINIRPFELTCHMPSGRNPVRIICDSHLRIPDNCKILETAQQARTIIATVSEDEKRIKQLEDRGAVIVKTAAFSSKYLWCNICLYMVYNSCF